MFGLVMVIPNLGISAVRKYISHKCTMEVTQEAEYNAFGIESFYVKMEDESLRILFTISTHWPFFLNSMMVVS